MLMLFGSLVEIKIEIESHSNVCSGSTPPVLLAAIRGYFLVVEVFKQFNTDFLVENKFQQSILHVVLKAGYYNKVRFTLMI